MKIKTDVLKESQPDPYVFCDGGRLYMYVTAYEGVECYSSPSPRGVFRYEGIVFSVPGGHKYWAPCVIKTGGKYYMYVSCSQNGNFQFLRVASADNPLGPFENRRVLYDRFSIDAHAVETESGLFLFYAENNTGCEKEGTRVFVDKLSDPLTPMNIRREVIKPEFPEEVTGRGEDGTPSWYTIEGPFWFSRDGIQYLMYSSGSFTDNTYFVGYCSAESRETDLTKVDFIKRTGTGENFAPVIFRGGNEEGTGHNSVILYEGEYYAFYHGRDAGAPPSEHDTRTARFCRLIFGDGEKLSAEQAE